MARKQTHKAKKIRKSVATEKGITPPTLAPTMNFYLVSSFTVYTQAMLQNVFTIIIAASLEEAMQRARQKYNNKSLTVTKIELGEYLSYAER